MQKDIDVLVDRLIHGIIYADETCALREFAGKWGCDIGNCDKCGALAIKLICQRWKEKGNAQNGQ